ncbi:PREDICTED: alpha-1,4-N-acetylglucosaminyltransferase-like [Nanorana parkeri]|uniref:alpha-1,4-N-acetylglucosaminyltransferase-like n=1 Tax=Nanorana parkeri TaxID=125878 RepID=UPI000854877A|nr:PREDICTED: alpha-1,4-N-acetylglucosaminyltransferase-like [Nanorana parkeri]
MIKYLKIVIFVLIFTVVGFVYRMVLKETSKSYISFLSQKEIFKTLKSKLISFKEDGRTSWNNSDDLFNMTTDAASAMESMTTTTSSSSLSSSLSSTSSSPRTATPLSSASSGHLNPSDILRVGNCIIFVETTDRMQPPSLVLCAIESAARVYKDRPVVYFMKGLTEANSDAVKNKYFPNFIPFNNVYFFPLRMEEVFAETALLSWYKKVDPSREVYWTHVSADGCRLALIWRYGGIYMDSDIISMRQIPNHNFLAAESNRVSSNGVIGFSSHHDFTWKSMEDFVRNYQGAVWGFQGPSLFTRILKTFCSIPAFTAVKDVRCGNITFLHPQRFYPIPYPAWRRYYEVWAKEPTFDNSYALHLWNYMNRNERRDMVPGSNSLVEHIYQKYCPSTYSDLAENKTTS